MNTNIPMMFMLDPIVECSLRDANDCMMHGDYDTALKLYDQVIEKQPYNSRALMNKGNVLDLMGNHSEAIRCFDNALACDPYNAEAWYNKGVTLKKIGSLEEGTLHIKKGLSLSTGEI